MNHAAGGSFTHADPADADRMWDRIPSADEKLVQSQRIKTVPTIIHVEWVKISPLH
jgi:hypothetical protein